MVRDVTPVPDTVTVPERLEPVFAVAFMVKVPLFDPLVGDTVIQLWLSVTDHAMLDVTFTVPLLAPDPKDTLVVETFSELPDVPVVTPKFVTLYR
jgi:hypothetical protein